MKAMILAAGRGERMRPLTDATPKSLLEIDGKALIVHRIEALRAAGLLDLVINLGYRGEQIRATLGDGDCYGVRIFYSCEPEHALDTGGGIFQALPLLGAAPFVVVNSDIWTDYPLVRLVKKAPRLAYLVMVDNPPQHPRGDFALIGGRVSEQEGSRLTYSGICVLSPSLFDGCSPGRFSLVPLLRRAMVAGVVEGEHYSGDWRDIGTPQRLYQLEAELHRAGRSSTDLSRL